MGEGVGFSTPPFSVVGSHRKQRRSLLTAWQFLYGNNIAIKKNIDGGNIRSTKLTRTGPSERLPSPGSQFLRQDWS